MRNTESAILVDSFLTVAQLYSPYSVLSYSVLYYPVLFCPILSSPILIATLRMTVLHKYAYIESYPDLLTSSCAHVLSVQLQVRYASASRAMCVCVRVCMRGRERERLSAACSVLNHR